jgi:hypothetical protein
VNLENRAFSYVRWSTVIMVLNVASCRLAVALPIRILKRMELVTQ